MLKRVAIFRDFTYDLTLLREEKESAYTDMVRVTEYAEVDFKPLTAEEISAQVDKIDEQIAKISERNQKSIDILNRQKTDILSQVFSQ